MHTLIQLVGQQAMPNLLAAVAVPEGKDASAVLKRFGEAFGEIAKANNEPGPWADKK